jgi:hypothetical protein
VTASNLDHGTRLDRWLEEWPQVTAQGLGGFRIVFAAAVLLLHHPARTWVNDLPAAWWAPPPGPMALLTGPPPDWLVIVGHISFGVLAGLLLVGYRTGWVSVFLTANWLLLNGVAYSWGKIDHGSLIAFVPLALAAAGWGNRYSVDAAADRIAQVRGWPVTLLAFLLATAWATAALPKVVSGWLNLETEATRGHLLRNHLVHGRDELLAPIAAELPLGFAWPMLDIVVIAVEVALAFLIIHRSWFRGGLVLLIGFHFGVLVTMNISFTTNVWVYAAFAPATWWSWFVKRSHIPVQFPVTMVPVGLALGGGASAVVLVAGAAVFPAALDLLGVRKPSQVLAGITMLASLALVGVWLASALGRQRMARSDEDSV